ncbi:MAG: D-tyrosyl-tRNA(Tyr) deacylase [Thermoanaerobaculia bacterium]|nr:D-tyrosyl-tRNA(Tyr) deacylase [Thermoanaerobaculia bacterium]MBP9824193.1 D-tyrosyl-tRNA(Tyr) deacylase [Thermoanaerobaculia bacterium]
MRIVLQRVSRAAVVVDGREVASIGAGCLLLVCVARGDDAAVASRAARKIAGLRLFEDAAGRMNLDLAGVGGALLVVSQFTLLADVSRGRRPSFEGAAPGDVAEPLVELFVGALREAGFAVATGRFGAHMQVELVNDGPVTLVLDF